MKNILVGVPCYNCENTIKKLIDDMKIFKEKNQIDFYFINDGSSDKTSLILKNSQVNYFDSEINEGYGSAVKKVINQAIIKKYDYCLIFPGDYQRSFSDISRLIEAASEKNYDTVTGSKFHIFIDNKGPVGRKIGNKIFTNLAKIFWNSKIQDVLSGFKIYKIKSIKSFYNFLPNNYSFDIIFSYFAAKNNLYQFEISVDCKYNKDTSKIKSILLTALIMLKDIIFYKFKF